MMQIYFGKSVNHFVYEYLFTKLYLKVINNDLNNNELSITLVREKDKT